MSVDDVPFCCMYCEDRSLVGLSPLSAMTRRKFPMCPSCGNKRCPRATHHDNLCTRSNEPGQSGSSYT